MDTHDKQFDQWIRDSLEVEISVNKHAKQTAWEQIRLKASAPEPLFISAYAPMPAEKGSPLTRVWNEILRLVTQEKTYHEARAKAGHNHIPQSNYYGGLSLHNMELIRQRWAFPV